MKTFIIAVLLLSACGAAESGHSEKQVTQGTQLTSPQELTGNWCGDGVCLRVSPYDANADWAIYNWTGADCEEGGFMTLDAAGLRMGAVFPDRGCFSSLTPSDPYHAVIYVGRDDLLTVQLSVLDSPLLLSLH